jgi:NitT/TauT family transport system permease protein
MSAELIIVAANQTSIGQLLQSAGKLLDMQQLLAIMIVIFVFGILVDSLFGTLDTAVRRRWGLLGSEA